MSPVYLYSDSRPVKEVPGSKVVDQFHGQTVLAFSPHSDDLSISAGGFLYQLAQDNTVIPVLSYTGWRGVAENVPKEEAVGIREQEMREEAAVLGAQAPIFLRLATYESDDRAMYEKDVQRIVNIVHDVQPDLILLPHREDVQPRHRLMTELILAALDRMEYEAGLIFYETPWSLFEAAEINLLVPLSEGAREHKMAAIQVHDSQLKRTDFARISEAMLALRAFATPEQRLGGYGSAADLDLGEAAEAFAYEWYSGADAPDTSG